MSMKRIVTAILLCGLLTLLVGCTRPAPVLDLFKGADPRLKEAYAARQETVELEKEIAAVTASIKQHLAAVRELEAVRAGAYGRERDKLDAEVFERRLATAAEFKKAVTVLFKEATNIKEYFPKYAEAMERYRLALLKSAPAYECAAQCYREQAQAEQGKHAKDAFLALAEICDGFAVEVRNRADVIGRESAAMAQTLLDVEEGRRVLLAVAQTMSFAPDPSFERARREFRLRVGIFFLAYEKVQRLLLLFAGQPAPELPVTKEEQQAELPEFGTYVEIKDGTEVFSIASVDRDPHVLTLRLTIDKEYPVIDGVGRCIGSAVAVSHASGLTRLEWKRYPSERGTLRLVRFREGK